MLLDHLTFRFKIQHRMQEIHELETPFIVRLRIKRTSTEYS
jgi:uncharacterized protein involved in tolerance to divalent cations